MFDQEPHLTDGACLRIVNAASMAGEHMIRPSAESRKHTVERGAVLVLPSSDGSAEYRRKRRGEYV